MALVRYTCPHCGFVFQPFSTPTYSFGDPRCICQKCNGVYIATHIIEWDLINSISKFLRIIGFYFHLVFGPLVLSGILAFIVGLIAQFFGYKILLVSQICVYYPLVFYWMYWDEHRDFWNAIRASKLRTSNVVYRKEIERYF